MPYQKKTRKRNYKKGPPKHTVKAVEKKVARLIRERAPEVKYKNGFETAPGSAINWTGYTLSLFNLVQGTDSSQRIGDVIRAKYFRYKAVINSAVNGQASQVRFILFKNHGPTVASHNDILEYVNSNLAAISPRSLASIGQGTILYDRTVTVKPPPDAGTNVLQQVNINVPLDFKIRYLNAGAIYPIDTNLKLFVFSSENPSGAANDMPTLSYWYKVTFTDE